jgi:hypothetical protein
MNLGTALTKLGQQPSVRSDRKLEAAFAALGQRREHSLDPAIEAAVRDMKSGHGFQGIRAL